MLREEKRGWKGTGKRVEGRAEVRWEEAGVGQEGVTQPEERKDREKTEEEEEGVERDPGRRPGEEGKCGNGSVGIL